MLCINAKEENFNMNGTTFLLPILFFYSDHVGIRQVVTAVQSCEGNVSGNTGSNVIPIPTDVISFPHSTKVSYPTLVL